MGGLKQRLPSFHNALTDGSTGIVQQQWLQLLIVNLQEPPQYSDYAITPSPNLRPEAPYSIKKSLQQKARSIWVTLALWVFTFAFIVLCSVYVYQVLLSPAPSLGKLLLPASGTNVIITVLSQVFVNAADVMICSILDHLRWHLAARTTGVSFLAFFGLSSATDWLSVLWFTVGGKVKTMWGAVGPSFVRLLSPAYRCQCRCLRKVVEFDSLALKSTPVNIVTVYFTDWANTFLNVPQYASYVSLLDCDGFLCKSVILPGGLENFRNVAPMVNSTVLQQGLFDDTEVIQIDDATGFFVKFELMGDDDYKFEVDNDCGFYGASVNDSLRLWLKPVGSSIAVGKWFCLFFTSVRPWYPVLRARTTGKSAPRRVGTSAEMGEDELTLADMVKEMASIADMEGAEGVACATRKERCTFQKYQVSDQTVTPLDRNCGQYFYQAKRKVIYEIEWSKCNDVECPEQQYQVLIQGFARGTSVSSRTHMVGQTSTTWIVSLELGCAELYKLFIFRKLRSFNLARSKYFRIRPKEECSPVSSDIESKQVFNEGQDTEAERKTWTIGGAVAGAAVLAILLRWYFRRVVDWREIRSKKPRTTGELVKLEDNRLMAAGLGEDKNLELTRHIITERQELAGPGPLVHEMEGGPFWDTETNRVRDDHGDSSIIK
ncbi:hypothetical protein MKZ38_007316 [Zalerion maritima]|uniref:Uncharacterized protein n=1 Tax=Zalerion maritima TaxID=339359 RepID=A0AAD5RIK1_9PEZI|nr:hypothetical protein MKZ38_007316 [Zalerion maritima]